MTQNRSHAVMSQRAEPNDSLDFFPTPPWATRALCEYLKRQMDIGDMSVWEPACGEGHMARPLAEYFRRVDASDVHDYSPRSPGQQRVIDFLWPDPLAPHQKNLGVDWIITNPPFRLGMEFAITGIARARVGVALLVRTAFLESGQRYAQLFGVHRPVAILQFCERVPMVKGRYDPMASTATSYCWILWRQESLGHPKNDRTLFFWIPPCRDKLQRPSDFGMVDPT